MREFAECTRLFQLVIHLSQSTSALSFQTAQQTKHHKHLWVWDSSEESVIPLQWLSVWFSSSNCCVGLLRLHYFFRGTPNESQMCAKWGFLFLKFCCSTLFLACVRLQASEGEPICCPGNYNDNRIFIQFPQEGMNVPALCLVLSLMTSVWFLCRSCQFSG